MLSQFVLGFLYNMVIPDMWLISFLVQLFQRIWKCEDLAPSKPAHSLPFPCMSGFCLTMYTFMCLLLIPSSWYFLFGQVQTLHQLWIFMSFQQLLRSPKIIFFQSFVCSGPNLNGPVSTNLTLTFWVKCLALNLFNERVEIGIMLIQTIKDLMTYYLSIACGILVSWEPRAAINVHTKNIAYHNVNIIRVILWAYSSRLCNT